MWLWIPYGGGSSVCGGVETDEGGDFKGVISLDMKNLDQIIEIDKGKQGLLSSKVGYFGPDLESKLKEHELTMRHYPQSFEFSTLRRMDSYKIWRPPMRPCILILTILLSPLTMLTPSGSFETRRLPWFLELVLVPIDFAIGSEGIMGIITSASMRLQDRPTFRASSTVEFEDYQDALNALRQISQSGLFPANCRLLDSSEALLNGVGDGSRHLLILSFESADHDKSHALERALEIAAENKGLY